MESPIAGSTRRARMVQAPATRPRAERDLPLLDVVVVHYRAPDALRRQIEKVDGWSTPPSITVVDNSAADGTAGVLRQQLGARVTLLEAPDNLGYGAAVNKALQTLLAAPAPYVLVATQDAVYDQLAIASLIRYLDADSRAAVAAPLLTYSSDPLRVFSAGGMLDSKACGSHSGHGTDRQQWEHLPPYEVAWADGSLLLLRKEALRRVGGFDERYFLYFEEVDLQLRLRLAGWSVRIVPSAVCSQEPGAFTPYLRVRNRALLQRSFPHLFDQRPRVTTVDTLRVLALGLLRREWSAPYQVLRALQDLRRGRFGNPSHKDGESRSSAPRL